MYTFLANNFSYIRLFPLKNVFQKKTLRDQFFCLMKFLQILPIVIQFFQGLVFCMTFIDFIRQICNVVLRKEVFEFDSSLIPITICLQNTGNFKILPKFFHTLFTFYLKNALNLHYLRHSDHILHLTLMYSSLEINQNIGYCLKTCS